MKRIFKILTIPVTLAIDLFTLICIGLISFSGMLLRLVSGIIGILGIAVLVTYSPKNGLMLLTIAFLVSPMGLPMAEIKVLQQHIINYAKTRDTYVAYRKAGYSRKFLSEHESEIILHKAAKQFFDEQGLKKLPTIKSLQAEYAQLLSEKKAMYADYQKAKEDMRSLQTAKANVDRILGDNSLTAEREFEKDGR